jgi:hypothetical protein
MKYWPSMHMMNCGRLEFRHRVHLSALLSRRAPIPHETMTALHKVACTLPACTSMALIFSEGAPVRRTYLRHPTQENWLQLERGGFIATDEDFAFILDALH